MFATVVASVKRSIRRLRLTDWAVDGSCCFEVASNLRSGEKWQSLAFLLPDPS